MEFLKDIAIPQSLEHFHLLVLIATLSSIVFIPYVSMVFGSSLLSLWYNRKGRTESNILFLQIAHELIDIVLWNKSLITFLAILPGLSLVLVYAQLLQGTSSLGVSLAAFGFVFLLVAMVFLYSYKYTFRVREMLGSYQAFLKNQQDAHLQKDVADYQISNTQAHHRSGSFGTIFLFIAIILYSAALSVTANPLNWDMDSVFELFVSVDVWLKLCEILFLALGITGIGILFFSFAWEYRKDYTEEYSSLVKKIGIRISIAGLLGLPIVVLWNTAVVPDAAISGIVYSLIGAAVVFLFLAAHFIYGYWKSPQAGVITAGFVLFLFAAGMLIISDNAAMGTATRGQAAVLAEGHEKSMEELKARLGVATVTFTGEDIYNARCSACHLFDQKKVGPPYVETLPKYQGKKADLVAFILNPIKKNPAYPPMPNQGLRPAEADSIASYILHRVALFQSSSK